MCNLSFIEKKKRRKAKYNSESSNFLKLIEGFNTDSQDGKQPTYKQNSPCNSTSSKPEIKWKSSEYTQQKNTTHKQGAAS